MKKILLITESFYYYDECIEEEIRRQGYEVTLFQAFHGLTYMEKLLHRRNLDSYVRNKKKKEQHFLLEERVSYEVVLVIGGHSIDLEIFMEFRRRQPKARFLFYIWDDIARVKNYEALKDCFDRVITFDRVDAINYQLFFRPNFFLEEYWYDDQKKIIDICFVGGLHSNRKEILNHIINQNIEKNIFIYLVTGRFTCIKERISALFNKKDVLAGQIKSKTINLTQSASYLKQSRIGIDIPHRGQKGLPFRALECMAAKTKLVTTNRDIVHYNFYREENIYILEEDNPVIQEEFFDTPWVELEEEVLEMYSLQSWVKDILSDEITHSFTKL